jgi:hypothetical protein
MSYSHMDDGAKLRVLIQHWMEHNSEHAREFTTWAAKAGDMGQPEARKNIEDAARQVEKVNDFLLAALKSLREG